MADVTNLADYMERSTIPRSSPPVNISTSSSAVTPPIAVGVLGPSWQTQREPYRAPARYEFESKISALEQRVGRIEKAAVGFVKINILPSKSLKEPLDAVVEPDADGFIARTVDLPLYGSGDDVVEAIDALKCEIESLYNDLMEDDEFNEEWLRIKKFLEERIFEK